MARCQPNSFGEPQKKSQKILSSTKRNDILVACGENKLIRNLKLLTEHFELEGVALFPSTIDSLSHKPECLRDSFLTFKSIRCDTCAVVLCIM